MQQRDFDYIPDSIFMDIFYANLGMLASPWFSSPSCFRKNCWGYTVHVFSSARCHSCHPTNSVKVLNIKH